MILDVVHNSGMVCIGSGGVKGFVGGGEFCYIPTK